MILPSTSHLPRQPRRSASGDKGSSGQGDNPKDRRALLPRHRLRLLTPRRRAAGHGESRPDGEDLFFSWSYQYKTFIQVKIWRIPRTGLSSNLTVPEVSLCEQARRVETVSWHPTAEALLASSRFDLGNKQLSTHYSFFLVTSLALLLPHRGRHPALSRHQSSYKVFFRATFFCLYSIGLGLISSKIKEVNNQFFILATAEVAFKGLPISSNVRQCRCIHQHKFKWIT